MNDNIVAAVMLVASLLVRESCVLRYIVDMQVSCVVVVILNNSSNDFIFFARDESLFYDLSSPLSLRFSQTLTSWPDSTPSLSPPLAAYL